MSGELVIKPARVVYRDGRHNAFVSLARAGDKNLLAFRNAAGHLEYDGKIVLLASDNNGVFWRRFAEISVPGIDLRDPFLVDDPAGTLVYAITRERGAGFWEFTAGELLFRHTGEGDFIPVPLLGLPEGAIIWKVRRLPDRFLASGYRQAPEQPDGHEAWILESPDGISWNILAGPFPGNEVAFAVAPDGVLTAIVRRELAPHFRPELLRFHIDTPGQTSRVELDRPLQGVLIEPVGGQTLVAARTWEGPKRAFDKIRFETYIMDDDGKLTPHQTIAAGGDCTYPSLLELSPGRGLFGYYASHNYLPGAEALHDPEHELPADIFVADIEWTP